MLDCRLVSPLSFALSTAAREGLTSTLACPLSAVPRTESRIRIILVNLRKQLEVLDGRTAN